ncbi:MAG TPA: hypothetical protein PKH10_11840, partial [bacterium]|nr:hypothetical protein [bacterium]
TITDKNITLWGACVEGTILSPTTPMEDEATDAIIRIDGTNPEHKVVVKNLTLTGGQRRGMNITGITAEVSHVEIVSAKKGGVLVDYGGSLTASSVRIRDTLSDSSNASGVGMALYDDVTVLLDRVILERNRTVGIHAVSTGISQVHFEATDMIVRDTQEQEGEKDLGNGIFLLNNVTAVLKRVLIERNRNIGLAAATENGDTKCSLQAEDIVVRDTRSTQNDQTEGKGIFVARNTEALLARTLIEENRYVGMVVASDVEGVSARLSASDTIVKDTEAQEAPEAQKSGRGISLEGNVQMTFSRILLQNNKEAGLVAKTENTEFLCSIGGDSLMVRETKETVDEQKDGRGIHLENNVSANFDRVLVEKNRTMGLSALTLLEGAQGSLQMTDFIIRDTQAQKSDHRFGEGVFVQEAFTVDLRRGAIVDNREAGVFLLDALDMYTAPPTVTLSDVKISGTKIRECSELKIDCVYAPDAPFGHGLGVYDGAEATLRNVEITNNTNGIQIRDSKVFSGDECSLAACSGTGIPVCLLLKDNETAINAFELPADYDINTAFAEGKTCYEGNDTNFSSEEQAVPEPPDPPEM